MPICCAARRPVSWRSSTRPAPAASADRSMVRGLRVTPARPAISEGDFRAGQGAHLGQARGQRAAGPQAELPVAGREPVLAGGTVIPGPGDAHRAQDGGDRLRATARIHGLPAAAAPARGPAYPSSCSSSTACSIAAPAVASAARIACSSTPSPRLPPSMPAARPASLPTSAAAISSIRAASPFFPSRRERRRPGPDWPGRADRLADLAHLLHQVSEPLMLSDLPLDLVQLGPRFQVDVDGLAADAPRQIPLRPMAGLWCCGGGAGSGR